MPVVSGVDFHYLSVQLNSLSTVCRYGCLKHDSPVVTHLIKVEEEISRLSVPICFKFWGVSLYSEDSFCVQFCMIVL